MGQLRTADSGLFRITQALMKKKLFVWLRMVASLWVICFLIRSMDVSMVLRPISLHGWLYLGLSVVILNLDRFLMSYKWSILLKARGIRFSFPELVRGYYIGTTWGSVLPGTIGGDVIRAYRLSHQGTASTDVVSSVILERALGAVAGLMMAALCLIVAAAILQVFPWWITLLTLLGGFLAIAFTWMLLRKKQVPDSSSEPSRPRAGWIKRLTTVYEACLDYRQHPMAMVRFVAWSLVEQCVPVVCVYLTALALGIPASLLSVATFTPLVVTLSKIPVSVDGFGIREGLYVYLLGLVGVTPSEAFTLGLVSHVIGNVSLLPGFLISIL
jgi:uncharacterized protein (TIRG00374 family)